MATIPPVNMGALKVTFPANLPRNEKDLICMLLAGRLKDLWNGKLICAQLALDDLIKSTTGVSGLETLRGALIKAKGSLDKFKQASGYDKILGGVNKALGQVSNVFSLGGLCPSPVQAPKIPDLLGQLSQNLFGQANGILNALAQASNPKVCLGGGPKGFGIDWSKVTGDLKNLRNAINQFKANPAGYQSTIAAFESNLKSQQRRLNAELKRLEKNLTDPLGINEKRATASAIQRAKSISDSIPVKDKNGIAYDNPLKLMISGEIEAVLARTDPLFASPVKYQTYPVYDYCGVLTGYERKIVTGDADYMGWDTVYTDNNTSNGTALPESTAAQYDYTLTEVGGQIEVTNKQGSIVSSIQLERAKHYRIKTKLTTVTLQILNGATPWVKGISITADPALGSGFEVITPDVTTVIDNRSVELDWAVSVENPTTPNALMLLTSSAQQINIEVSGITAIPEEDKTYDVSNAARKAFMFIKSVEHAYPEGTVLTEQAVTDKQFTVSTVSTGTITIIPTVTQATYNVNYSVIDDVETLDEEGLPIAGNKIIEIKQPYNGSYIISKLYVNETDGMDIYQYSAFLTDSVSNYEVGYRQLVNLKFSSTVEFLNDVKLPYTSYKEYMLTLADGTKLINTDQMTIEKSSNSIIRTHLSSNRQTVNTPGEFILTVDLQVDPDDIGREYQMTNPVLAAIRVQFAGTNFGFEQTFVLNN